MTRVLGRCWAEISKEGATTAASLRVADSRAHCMPHDMPSNGPLERYEQRGDSQGTSLYDSDSGDEATAAELFFTTFEEPWRLPRGMDGLFLRPLLEAEDSCMHGGTLIVAFSSGAAHFDFESSLRKLSSSLQNSHRLGGLLVGDSETAWFLRQDEASADAFDPVVELVQREIQRLQPERLLTIGYCRGGYAAVRAGVVLGADSVLAFSPQCFIDPAERKMLGLPATYYDCFLNALKEADAPLDSLSSVLSRTTCARHTSIELHVGAQDVGGVAEMAAFHKEWNSRAENRGASRVEISVQTHVGCGHEVPAGLKQSGGLIQLLERWVGSAASAERPCYGGATGN